MPLPALTFDAHRATSRSVASSSTARWGPIPTVNSLEEMFGWPDHNIECLKTFFEPGDNGTCAAEQRGLAPSIPQGFLLSPALMFSFVLTYPSPGLSLSRLARLWCQTLLIRQLVMALST